MKNLIGDTIAKIKKQGITPEPRWKYLAKKYGVWLAFAVVVILGALSFSVTIDVLSQLDWDLYRFVNQNKIIYSLSLLPYFWLVIVGLLIVVTFFDLRKTETGYRYGLLKMSLLSVGGIIATGTFFFLVGVGGKFNSTLSIGIPYYGQHMMVTKQSQWSNPDSGFLSGTLNAVSSSSLKITDFSGQPWSVTLDEKTLIRPAANIAQGEMIKIIGIKKSAGIFKAIEIRPWMGQGMMNRAGSGGGMMNRNGGGRGMMGQ